MPFKYFTARETIASLKQIINEFDFFSLFIILIIVCHQFKEVL